MLQASYKALQEALSVCGYVEESGKGCAGSWRVVRPREGRPFIRCTGWKPGDPPTRAGGHFACKLKDGVNADLLEKYCDEGPPSEPPEQTEKCIFIAPKSHKGKLCKRHGGEDPALVRAGPGGCPVRARLLHPAQVADATSVRVALLLFGEHNHIYSVCKPPVSAIAGAVAQQPNASVRVLQVRGAHTYYYGGRLQLVLFSLISAMVIVTADILTRYTWIVTVFYLFPSTFMLFGLSMFWCHQRVVADECNGAHASPGHIKALRTAARATRDPHGQDILGVLDLRRRAGADHSYIRGVVEKDDHKIVFLQSDRQAQISGRLPYVMADTTFDVVAPGAAKEGVSQAAIDGCAPRAFDWHHFSIVYVFLFHCTACIFLTRLVARRTSVCVARCVARP